MNRYFFIIPAGKKDAANTAAKATLDTRDGERSFRRGLSADGNLPATHYVASGVFKGKASSVEAIRLLDAGATVVEWDIKSTKGLPDSLLKAAGLQVIRDEPTQKAK